MSRQHFIVEPDVVIPPRKVKEKGSTKYPFPTMKPGDSFALPCDNPKHQRKTSSAMSSVCRRWMMASGQPDWVAFVIRQLIEGERLAEGQREGEGTPNYVVRVWMVDTRKHSDLENE